MSQQSSPEQLIKFIYEFIRNNCNQPSDNVDESLNQIADMYQKLDDKIYFGMLNEYSFVQRYLAFGKKSLELEDKINQKIREINPGFMNSYERYLGEFRENEEMNEEYKGDKLNALVLKHPLLRHLHLNVTTESFSQPISNFEAYYNNAHPDQNIILVPELSTVQLTLKTKDEKSYDVVTNLPQAIVLVSLSSNPLKFASIVKLLDDKNLASEVVKVLYDAKLIKKNTETQQLSDDDEFSINDSFTSEQTKVVIPLHVEVLDQKTLEKILYTKCDSISAACVRALKRHGKIELNKLKENVTEQLKASFTVTPELFDRAINLISNYYTKNEENGQTIFLYQP